MMDVKAFSGEEFNVKDWINKTFQQESAQNKEQHASSLVMKLQLLIAKMNANLEDHSEQVLQSMPRIMREVESLQQDAALLKSSMSAVQSDIDTVNENTGSSMGTLVKMDLLKNRIEAVALALKEADNWTTLTNEIEDALDSGDLPLISQKLTLIQGSLKILSHVPDYEDRVILVEGLKNRLEALASPQLVLAFNTNDKEKSKFFDQVFSDMNRAPQLLKYYRKCVRARALKAWSNVVEENEQFTVLEWSKSYFSYLRQQVEIQSPWFQEVFPHANHVENMIEIMLDILINLDPGLEFCLSAGLKQQTDPLDYLINVKQIFNEFLAHLDGLLLLPNYNEKRNHTRMRELAKNTYLPFKSHLTKYEVMETAKLMSDLKIQNTTTSKDILDELRLISMSVPKLVESFTSASKRCLALSEGVAVQSLINAYEECLTKYLERFAHLMKRLEKRKTAAHSWNILQQSLTLNQTCGDLLLQFEQMDINLSISFLDRTKAFLVPHDHEKVIHQHHLYLLDVQSQKMRDLIDFHSQIKQGSTSYPIMAPLLKMIRSTCENLQSSTFTILFHPIKEQLALVDSPTMLENIWTSISAGADTKEPDMPDFSFSPQEYITQIGQYLMTLPQHLEPYMTNDNISLSRALQERVFPFCTGVGSRKETDIDTPADFLLSCISRATCQTYQDHILNIPSLSRNSTKQLYTDIGYLGDILEDLGHPLTEGLSSLSRLLRVSPKELRESKEPQTNLVSAIKKMRIIK